MFFPPDGAGGQVCGVLQLLHKVASERRLLRHQPLAQLLPVAVHGLFCGGVRGAVLVAPGVGIPSVVAIFKFGEIELGNFFNFCQLFL